MKYLEYLIQELKPEIEKKYQVSSYSVLSGHSLGGLFITNVFLEKPSSFSAYIAVDPSYWWDDYEIVKRTDSLLENKEDFDREIFISLADSKRMGVHEFVGTVEKHLPRTKLCTYRLYTEENHGSVGLISFRDGLLKIFDDWELTRDEFFELETGAGFINYYKDRATKYESKLRIPPNQLANSIYYYHRDQKQDELRQIEEGIKEYFPASVDDFYSSLGKYMLESEDYEKAESMLKTYVKENPTAFKSIDILSKLYYKNDQLTPAKMYSELAIAIAKELKVRQWQLNELESNLTKINAKE